MVSDQEIHARILKTQTNDVLSERQIIQSVAWDLNVRSSRVKWIFDNADLYATGQEGVRDVIASFLGSRKNADHSITISASEVTMLSTILQREI